ncbi:hypothetical protein FIBSPDRAFT_824515 [Athelia psychrophila]|uniref:DUF4604 domain-containing protein n=1 Tax=Athelia psychrophila TaxID=1759441 RepID=A0A166L718_9AGAM|nr:hypothetical protein FIBSPDRAFT_824515 [Fibularhizoctonia sp. CBS 109695]
MPPREPTNAQISSQLSYSQNVPSFLQKFKNRTAGIPDEPEDDEYYEEDGQAYYDDGTGRPPIPQRPSIPERPEDDPGSQDEDDGDEKPQVVVLRHGKHLTEREAENERRKEKGLQPLPDPTLPATTDESSASGKAAQTVAAAKKDPGPSLSFSSKGSSKSKSTSGKRKAIGDPAIDDKKSNVKTKKKKVKGGKALLSFGDDEP